MIKKFTIEKTIHLIFVLVVYVLFTTLVIIPKDWNGDIMRVLLFYMGITSWIVIFYCQTFWLFPKYIETKKIAKYFLLLTLIVLALFLIHSTLQTIDFQKQDIKKHHISSSFFETYFGSINSHLRWLVEIIEVLLVSVAYSVLKWTIQKGIIKTKTLVISLSAALVFAITLIGGIFFYNSSYKGDQKIKFINNSDQYQKIEDLISLNELKGNVLYVDIWGAYCGPCLQEFKYLKNLKDRYKNKPVKFAYLVWLNRSVDVARWKNIIKKNEIAGYHMQMNLEFYKNIWTIDSIKYLYWIPHYIIVDKKENIVIPNAEWPSSGEKLFSQLDNIVNQ